jgi:hypothetical protein
MKVKAKNETIAKFIRHPSGGSFQSDGTANWPNDQFTKRRIRDGDITVVEAHEEQQSVRQHQPRRSSRSASSEQE